MFKFDEGERLSLTIGTNQACFVPVFKFDFGQRSSLISGGFYFLTALRYTKALRHFLYLIIIYIIAHLPFFRNLFCKILSKRIA